MNNIENELANLKVLLQKWQGRLDRLKPGDDKKYIDACHHRVKELSAKIYAIKTRNQSPNHSLNFPYIEK